MLIAQISDLHVNAPDAAGPAGTDAIAAAHRLVDHLLAMRPGPDVVLASGDLAASHGTPAEYEALRTALGRLQCPVFLIPGNHDNRAGLRAAFPDHAYLPAAGPMHYVVDSYPLRLVGLDTQIEGQPGGTVDEAALVWLEATLSAAPETPTIVFMHHPPFRSGIAVMDGMMCANGPALEAVLRRHPQVHRLLCGHVHRPIQRLWGGTLAMIAPSSVVQLSLSLGDAAKPTYIHEPPAFLLHHWDGDAVTSHVVTVGDYETTPP